jgi:hypothetical protein
LRRAIRGNKRQNLAEKKSEWKRIRAAEENMEDP